MVLESVVTELDYAIDSDTALPDVSLSNTCQEGLPGRSQPNSSQQNYSWLSYDQPSTSLLNIEMVGNIEEVSTLVTQRSEDLSYGAKTVRPNRHSADHEATTQRSVSHLSDYRAGAPQTPAMTQRSVSHLSDYRAGAPQTPAPVTRRSEDHDYGQMISAQAGRSNRRSADHEATAQRSVSHLSDYGAGEPQTPATARNLRARVISDEFALRQEKYELAKNREEELHQSKLAEQNFLIKAAEEKYIRCKIERESAEELLKCNKAKREEAELRLSLLKRDLQQT